MPDTILTPEGHTVPAVFTRAQLDWLAWLEPMPEAALTERHIAALVDAARVRSPYFRLLVRDPDALEARTRADKDIFYDADAGLPRVERELAAAAASRLNGCIYCASSSFGAAHVERLRRLGLDDLAISDLIHAVAFFNWANRLMLSLGEPAA